VVRPGHGARAVDVGIDDDGAHVGAEAHRAPEEVWYFWVSAGSA
jgi:hypothetical protein